MHNQQKKIAFIPARGGSKRVPGKNKAIVGGKPLLCYTLDAIRDSSVFDEIILSTDDPDLVAIAKKYDLTIDERPKTLQGDYSKAVEVVFEYLSRSHYLSGDIIAMLLPTCPFRSVEDIKKAFELFIQQPDDLPLMSVTAYDFPPQLAVQEQNECFLLDPAAYATTRSQSIDPRYHPNGGIYMDTVEGFCKRKTFFQEKMLCHVMPWIRSFDIDYPYQLQIANYIATEML